MSSDTDPAQTGSASSEQAELRQDIEQVRGELADTVNALADKADVKGRAQDKAQELKTQAIQTTQQVRAQASEVAQHLAGAAQQKAHQVIQEKPAAAAGAVLAVLGLLILRRRWRRRKEKGS
ncbi:MAG TPA: DUF3618 domain-containing protein [Pseudonocardiaceae bacterium]|jgi:ElaB/YqjD/DUF883 family membrane-anchored ribosome-binding protein|nr:DUF3618 domain-containing protein [Pseudonocardiaceae bacterium]